MERREQQDATTVLALELAAGRTPPPLDVAASAVDVLAAHGLLNAAALEGDPALRRLAHPGHVRAQARQRIMDRHRAEITELVAEAGIPLVVLKGQAVARFYANPQIRTSTDIDVLVPAKSVDAAVEVIRGYPFVTDVPRKGPKADKRHIMIRDGSGVNFILDVHWHLYSYSQMRGRADAAMDEIWSGVESTPDGYRLPLPAELTFLATHAILDHRFRLILFRDLAELATHEIDWESVITYATRHGLRSVTWAALSAASMFADAAIPDEALKRLATGSLPEKVLGRQLERVDPVRFDGHAKHPLNLAAVLLHDDPVDRLVLASRAPRAIRGWRHRVETLTRLGPRRVLVIVTSDQRRGAEVFGESLAASLTERGWDVGFVCLSRGPGPTVSAKPVEGASGSLGRLNLEIVKSLRRWMAGVDVVLANGSATLQYALAASRMMPDRPAVVYSSIGEPSYWARGGVKRTLQRRLYRSVDRLAAVSEATRRQLIEDLEIPESTIAYAPTGVAPIAASPTIDHERLRLVWIGSLSPEKQPEKLFEMIEIVDAEVEVRIVGEGPFAEAARERAADDDRVEVVGAVDQVHDELAWADVLVQTSATEGLPGVVMEAAAHAVPAIAFDVGGTRELVLNQVTGFLVAKDDIAGLADAVARFEKDRDLVRLMGEAAREHVRSQFSLESAVDRWEAVLEAAISGRRR